MNPNRTRCPGCGEVAWKAETGRIETSPGVLCFRCDHETRKILLALRPPHYPCDGCGLHVSEETLEKDWAGYFYCLECWEKAR